MSTPDPVEQALDSIAHAESRHVEWGAPEYREGLCHPACLDGWWIDEYGEYPCQACNPDGGLRWDTRDPWPATLPGTPTDSWKDQER